MKGSKVSGTSMPAGATYRLNDSYFPLDISFTATHLGVQVDSKGELIS